MQKIKMFGKSVPIAVIAMLLVVGIASAALVTYYAKSTGTVDVVGPLSISPSTWTLSLFASETKTQVITVTNSADQDIDAELSTNVTGPGLSINNVLGDSVGDIDTDGIVVTYSVTTPMTFVTGSSTEITITVTTNPALVPGTYTIETSVVPP